MIASSRAVQSCRGVSMRFHHAAGTIWRRRDELLIGGVVGCWRRGDRTEVRAWSAIMPVTPAWLHEYPSVCLCLCRVVQTTYSLASVTYTTNKPCAYKVNKSRRLMDKAHFAELVYNLNLITESSSWRKYSYENEAIHAYRLSRRSAVQLDLLLWRNDYSAPDRGAEYCDERVCLCVCVCPRTYFRNYTSDLHQFLCTLPMAVARSSSGGAVIRHVFPVCGWRHICTYR